ncbi:MAG TPA: substrate-binding domain-containing protein [Candidatus Sulfomarinibacteraceae bacterium]|nr:substrate-binding domain-containing protein [Candidatus Sulfomarinibacteraceae bacterium]
MAERAEYLYQEISESIRRRIASGELKAGEKLPAIRQLAAQWDCTPGTVSRAYSLLADEGLVVAHRGSGTRVAPNVLQPPDTLTGGAIAPGAWGWANLVNRAEKLLLEGVGAGYTPEQIQAALAVAAARWASLQRETSRSEEETEPAGDRLRFAGSHDLTIEVLAQMLRELEPPMHLEARFIGSLGGLMALARGEADVAGAHLWDRASDTYNMPFVRRVLPGRRVALLTLAHRSQGLIVAPGNPRKITGLQDLARSDVRFVNRQSGSGTRVWLDAALARAGVSRDDVTGYERETPTHLALARAVAEGEADVGLGIHAAAVAFELEFIPLMQEKYELIFTVGGWESAPGQKLSAMIGSTVFRETVAALGGYDTARSGEVSWLDAGAADG